LREAWNIKTMPLSELNPTEINVNYLNDGWRGSLSDFEKKSHFNYEPHFGWRGHIEYKA